jgi:arylsulfatase A-like enzyme
MAIKKHIPMLAASLVVGTSLNSYAIEQQKPNVVFLEVDDLLYRFMGKLGRNFVKTPNIDKLAENGVYFSNAVCQGVMCGPSRNSLITGLYPHNLGFYINGQMHLLPNGVWSFAKGMKNAGYTTSWIGKCHVHPPRPNPKDIKPIAQEMMAQMGFDYAVASAGRVVLRKQIKKSANLSDDVYINHLKSVGAYDVYVKDVKSRAKVTSLSEDDYLDGYYTNQALKWIDKNDSKEPFFLWVNFSCPHGPFDVPQKYHDIYKNVEIPPPLTKDFGGVQVPSFMLADAKPLTEEDAKRNRKGYAANVTFVDTMIGKIIQKLKDNDEYENTMIVFFSDHGIFMGNHGYSHKGTIFNEITNPSLIVHYPKKFKSGVVDKPVELLGLVKTTLELVGAPKKDVSTPYSASFLPLLTGKGKYSKKYVFSEIEKAQLCFDGRYRYYANSEKPLLFDMKNDPNETKNIAESNPEIVAKMQRAVDNWLGRTKPVLKADAFKQDRKLFKNWKRGVDFKK